ncbi:MAG: hypothetical protein KAH77_02910 [Thiomargarita sp.]|nr:hypothetical protein [Thiomargarita sp.]
MINSGILKSSLALFKLYKFNWFLSIAVYTVLLFMLGLILNLTVILDYLFQAKYGFYPDVAVFVEKPHDKNFSADIHTISERFSAQVRLGTGVHIKNAPIKMDQEHYSLPEDVNLLGIDIKGDPNITLALTSSTQNCPVSHISYEGIGAWTLTFNPCIIEDVESIQGLTVIQGTAFQGGQHEIELDIDTHEAPIEQVRAFYQLLITVANRFLTLNQLGLPKERLAVSRAEERAIREFENTYSTQLHNMFSFIFHEDKVLPLLVDAQLYQNYSGYSSFEVSLYLETAQHRFPLYIYNKIYSAPELEATEKAQYFFTNIILSTQKAIAPIPRAFEAQDINPYQFAHFFQVTHVSQLLESLKKEWGDQASVLLKSDILPNIEAKKTIYNRTIFWAYWIIVGMVISILWISLNEFFIRFDKELTFMTVYGFQGLIFSSFQVLALLISAGISYLCLHLTFIKMNAELTYYYFPPVVINNIEYLLALATALLSLLPFSILLERYYIRNIVKKIR